MPKKQKAGPWQFTKDEIKSFSNCFQKVVKGYSQRFCKENNNIVDNLSKIIKIN